MATDHRACAPSKQSIKICLNNNTKHITYADWALFCFPSCTSCDIYPQIKEDFTITSIFFFIVFGAYYDEQLKRLTAFGSQKILEKSDEVNHIASQTRLPH